MHISGGAVRRCFSMIYFLLGLTWRLGPLIAAALGCADDTPACAALSSPTRVLLISVQTWWERRKITSLNVSLKSPLNWAIKQLLWGGSKTLERDTDKQDKRLFLQSDGRLNIPTYSWEQTKKKHPKSGIYFSVIEGENLTDWIFQRPWGRSLWKGP